MKDIPTQHDPLLVKAAVMKHHIGYSQREIAERLNVSTMTVSRLLEKARRTGVIEVVVHTPIRTSTECEELLKKRFQIEQAVVVRSTYGEDAIDYLARAAAFYLDLMVASGDIMAVSAGRTIRRVIPYLRLGFLARGGQLSVVQTMGGFKNPASYNPVSTLQEFAAHFGIEGFFFNLPVYAASKEAKKALAEHAMQESIERMWQKCTIAFTGVGPSGKSSIYRVENMLTKEEMDRLVSMGAVGAIYGRWFDIEGRFLDTEINERVLGIPIEVVKKIPKRILVSRGRDRLRAIVGVLKTGLFNVFITDEQTVRDMEHDLLPENVAQ